MTIHEWKIREADGQELDRLAHLMGYKRKGRIFKESDFDFKYRLIELNQNYLCPHDNIQDSYGLDDGVCGNCGKIF